MGKLTDRLNLWARQHKYAAGAIAYVLELGQVVIISLAIVLPIRYFLIQPFYVKGASMEPNFHDNEYLIIDELSYRFREPKRGEIVVFRYPLDPKQFFIKRVIGLPGDLVRIANSQIVIFNNNYPEGFALEESYLSNVPTDGDKSVKLEKNEYYVLGDNRPSSLDSRIFGVVPAGLITGRVILRGWPVTRLTYFEAPIYQAELQK